MILRRRFQSPRRTRLAVGALAVSASLLTLTACGSSAPSNRRIAHDIIDGLDEELTEAQRQCMLDYVDSLEGSAIDDLVEANADVRVDSAGNLVDPTPEMQEFQDRLAECRDAEPATTSDPDSTAAGSGPDTSAPDTTTPESTTADTTASPDTTAAESTTPDTTA